MSRHEFEPGLRPAERPGPSGGARDRNRVERTQAICRAALELFLERGVEVATVDEITRAAGVAKGSFYRYFRGKPQLVEALFAPLASELGRSFERCERALDAAASPAALTFAYRQLAVELAGALLGAPELVRLYLQERRGADEGARGPIVALAHAIDEGAIQLTESAHRRKLLRELPPTLTALAVVGAVEQLLLAAYQGRRLGDPAAAAEALISMMLDGVRKQRNSR